MTRMRKINFVYRNCLLLKNDYVKCVIDDCLKGFTLNKIEKNNDLYMCFFSCNKSILNLSIGKNFINLIEYRNNRIKSISIDMNMSLNKQIVEKRDKGILFIDVVMNYGYASRFMDENVLVDLYEKRYIFTDNKLEEIFNYDNFSEEKIKNIYINLKSLLTRGIIKECSDYYSEFSTHMNYFVDCMGKRRFENENFSNVSYLNGNDVSILYNGVEGVDKLFRIYDLYDGVITLRNIDDLNYICFGIIDGDAFGLRGLTGIKEEEEKLIGAVDEELEKKYINQLKQIFGSKFKVNKDIKYDRDYILNVVINNRFSQNKQDVFFNKCKKMLKRK